jgi:hypothetical protein
MSIRSAKKFAGLRDAYPACFFVPLKARKNVLLGVGAYGRDSADAIVDDLREVQIACAHDSLTQVQALLKNETYSTRFPAGC